MTWVGNDGWLKEKEREENAKSNYTYSFIDFSLL
jgi:hypothetical protein